MHFSIDKDLVTIGDLDFAIYITNRQIQDKLERMAADIYREYQDKTPIFLIILNGAFVFAADLLRHYDGACETKFVNLKSYEKTKSTGQVTVSGLEHIDITDRHIIILEDIVDTGISMHAFLPQLQAMNPASVKLASLLVKPEAAHHHIDVHFSGFKIPNDFVVGYGLDYAEEGRNLPHIYQLVENIE